MSHAASSTEQQLKTCITLYQDALADLPTWQTRKAQSYRDRLKNHAVALEALQSNNDVRPDYLQRCVRHVVHGISGPWKREPRVSTGPPAAVATKRMQY